MALMAGKPGLKSVECPIAFLLHESGGINRRFRLIRYRAGDKTIQNNEYEVES